MFERVDNPNADAGFPDKGEAEDGREICGGVVPKARAFTSGPRDLP